MLAEFIVGMIVLVGPDTQSIYASDRSEPEWIGRIERISECCVDIAPLDGKLPRDVLKDRIKR